MAKPKLVILTGAGISQESGISTFRDSGGLWENHRIEDVASLDGFRRDPDTVLSFYNARRAQLFEVEPNAAHYALATLERNYEVHIVTQNVDDLHERGGSGSVMHLHGELRKVRSTAYPELVYTWEKDLHLGDLCERGAQLRPHIVWFGEEVPLIGAATQLFAQADIAVVVGTSMQVYPAAGLISYTRPNVPLYYVDPHPAHVHHSRLTVIAQKATIGIQELIAKHL